MTELNLIELLRQTTPITRFVLAVLLIFSVWSWGIILSKALLLRKVKKESETFWKVFRRGQNLSEIRTACEALRFTPLVPVFAAGADLLMPLPGKLQSQGNLALKSSVISVATVQRIVHRHGGRAWAEGAVDMGATFYFSLSKSHGVKSNEQAGTHLTG